MGEVLRRRYLAIGIVMVVAAIAVGAIATRGPRGRMEMRGKEPSATDDPAASTPGAERDARFREGATTESRTAEPVSQSSRAAAPLTIDVISTEGLPLRFVELGDDQGHWREVSLVAGKLALSECQTASQIRAPGHLARALNATADIVQLMGDCVLRLRLAGISHIVREAQAFGWSPNSDLANVVRRTCAFGFPNDDTWVVMADAGRFSASHKGDLEVTLTLTNGTRIEVARRVQPAEHIDYALPSELIGLGGGVSVPLEIHIVNAANDRDSERFRVELWSVASTARQLPLDAHFQWGSVQAYLPSVHEVITLGPNELTTTFAAIPLENEYGASAVALRSGDYGRIVFQHDGSIRDVAVTGGIVIRGRVDAVGAKPPEVLDMSWDGVSGGLAASGDRGDRPTSPWHGEVDRLTLASDGEFHFSVPQRVPTSSDLAKYPLRGIVLHTTATGFQTVETTIALNDSRELDVGTLALFSDHPSFVVRPGHGISDASLKSQMIRESRPEGSVLHEVSGARVVNDGTLEVFLRGADGAVAGGRDRAPTVISAERILIILGERDGVLCRRISDGSYASESQAHYHVELVAGDMESLSGGLEYGWRVAGLECRMGRIPSGERVGITLDFDAPKTGVDVWWRVQQSEQRTMGAVPITEATKSVIIR